MSDADRAKLVAAQRDLDAKRAKLKAAKDADQSAADTKAKDEIARRMDLAREAAAADPERSRKIAEADARDKAKRARQGAAPPVAEQDRDATDRRSRGVRPTGKRTSASQRKPRGRKRYPPQKRRTAPPEPLQSDDALRTAVLDANGAEAILAALAHELWYHAHADAQCPDSVVPTSRDMMSCQLPPSAAHEAVALIGAAAGASSATVHEATSLISTDDKATTTIAGTFAMYLLWFPVHRTMPGLAPADIIEVAHAIWRDYGRHGRHPLAPLVAAWQQRPQDRPTERRTDRRIMPTLSVAGPSAERKRGLQIGGLIDDRDPKVLPLFPELPTPTRHRVPLLEIAEHATPLRSRGQGAPLQARLLVRAGLLMMQPQDRGLPTVRISVAVGELLDALWPPTERRTASGGTRYDRHDAARWPKLLDALHRARDLTVPVSTPTGPARWFPIALRQLPDGYVSGGMPPRDALVILDLAPPPSATSGPTVDLPWLDRMGVTSGPRWCAYIAARSLIWQPGRTRRIVPGTRRWAWSRRADNYPVLTLADLRRLAFGATDRKNRTRSAILAPWQDLPDVDVTEATDKRTGARGWRLMPPTVQDKSRA